MKDNCGLFSFDLMGCAKQLARDWLAGLPMEWLLGGAFLAGLVIGSLLGWRIVAAIGGGLLLLNLFGGFRPAVATEDIWPHPDEKPKRKPLFPGLGGGKRRTFDPTSDDGWTEVS